MTEISTIEFTILKIDIKLYIKKYFFFNLSLKLK